MSISGNIKTMALAELLQWLSQGQKSGTLVIQNEDVEKKIFFEEGSIISSASTDPREYLGRFLAGHGYVAEEQIDEAVARQSEEKRLLGQILVELGAIAEDDLHQVLRLKAEESIYDVFTWSEGDFEFLDGELPKETMVRMSLDVQWLVLEGSRRLDEWHRIKEWVPSRHCVVVSVADLEALEIDEVDSRILSWVDDERTVDEISSESQTSLFQVGSVLAEQVQTGTVKVVRPRTVKVEVPVEKEDSEAQAQQQQVVQISPQMTYPQPVMAMPGYTQQPPPYTPPPTPPPPPSVELAGGRTLHFAGEGAGAASDPPPARPAAPAATAAPPPPVSEALSLISEAEGALASNDLEHALVSFRKAKDAEGADAAVADAAVAGEEKVREALDREGVKLTTVPKLKSGMDELMKVKMSPQEGFMITRVDGSYDIASILKMSPMPKVDAQMLFWRLKKEGHVAV